ncbi:oxidoreductase, aldo/keto reductase family [Methylophaga frappieri]|uniref:Oxidoreductase, aldo/keto reductase family n=1 Tax=Methylophaga frappieri (strain ATCC BAA-2434 / DSM 25690 / JAM7) TaxID=754477 RepID=I1YKD8_METFJ|nr:aldo/keto reductase [Methylophaga frappieri]AFJ03381.1 oxidoreductase, aldo/keto reductase family [Methylophaga frappieri]
MSALKQTRIADSDVVVSALGLGTVKLGRNTGVKYPDNFTIPDDEAALKLLDTAWHLGVNLIDTAPAYGNSETRLGHLLPQLAHPFVICTKAGEHFDPETSQSHFDFSKSGLQRSVETSLKRLNQDTLDIVLIHSDGQDLPIIHHHHALDTLNEMKAQGLIKAVGMSTKTVAGGLQALHQSDIVMVTHNLAYQDEQAVLDTAAEQNKAIFIKKAFASGHLPNQDDAIQASFKLNFANPAVASIIIGTINLAHLTDNIVKANDLLARY